MRAWLKKWWPVGKLLLGLAIVTAIGLRFARDLREPGLWDRTFHFGWMALSGLLYLLALGCSALYWNRLLHGFGQEISASVTLRAYFVGQLGKYLPGKAMALVMRASLASGPKVRAGLAGLTAFYEVLMTMSTGALLAALLLFALGPVSSEPLDWHALGGLFKLETPPPSAMDRKIFVLVSLFLFAPLFLLIVPPVFNRLAHNLARPFREKDAPPLPRFRWRFIGLGLVVTGATWLFMGTSLLAMLHGVLGQPMPWAAAAGSPITAAATLDHPILDTPPPWTGEVWGLYTGYMCLAYVAGFVILLVPSGLGVREFFLTLFLVDPAAGRSRPGILLTVLVLRLVWTAAELLLAGVVYWLPRRGASKKE